MSRESFRSKLQTLINCESQENGSDTPDFILAGFLCACLDAFDHAVSARSAWNTRRPSTPDVRPDDAGIYPCDDCGKMRSKAEGGTVFTVCDVCWEKRYGKPTASTPDGRMEAELAEARDIMREVAVWMDDSGGQWPNAAQVLVRVRAFNGHALAAPLSGEPRRCRLHDDCDAIDAQHAGTNKAVGHPPMSAASSTPHTEPPTVLSSCRKLACDQSMHCTAARKCLATR